MKFDLKRDAGILVLEPESALSEQDFAQLSDAVDPYLDEKGLLNALVIHTPEFPGWSGFAGFLAHARFVKEHHARIRKLALVTDSALASIAPALARLFVAAEIKRFAYAEFDAALAWAGA